MDFLAKCLFDWSNLGFHTNYNFCLYFIYYFFSCIYKKNCKIYTKTYIYSNPHEPIFLFQRKEARS